MRKILVGLITAVFLIGCGSAATAGTPAINYDGGHLNIDPMAEGTGVAFFTVHGHDCIIAYDGSSVHDGESHTLSLSCDWNAK